MESDTYNIPWQQTSHTLFVSTELSPGVHNTLVFLVSLYIIYWLSNIFHKVFRYRFFILKKINPDEAFCLKGSNLYAEDLMLLSRTHFGQIVRQKRIVPPIPVPRINSTIHIHPSSMKLIAEKENTKNKRNSTLSSSQALCFAFDALKPCTIQIFWGVSPKAMNDLLAVPQSKCTSDPTNLRPPERIHSRATRLIENFFSSNRTNTNKQPNLEMNEFDSNYHRDIRTSEILRSDLIPTEYYAKSKEYVFQAGHNQIFVPNKEDMLDLPTILMNLSSFGVIVEGDILSEEKYSNTMATFPTIILASCTKKTNRSYSGSLLRSFSTFEADHQISILNFKVVQLQIECTLTKQFLFSTGLTSAQQTHEIYGLENVEEMECSICMSSLKDAMLLPCRHCSSCFDCIRSLHQERCPICRANFTGFVTFPLKNNDSDDGQNYIAINLPNYNEIS